MPNRTRPTTFFIVATACLLAQPAMCDAASRTPQSLAAAIPRDQHLDLRRQNEALELLAAAWKADPAYAETGGEAFRNESIKHLNISAALIADTSNPYQRAVILYWYLQDSVLVGEFDSGCARIARTLCNGDHNCLTSTLVYLALCRNAGIQCCALESPGHVRVQLTLKKRQHIVETTQRNGWSHATSMNEAKITDRQLIARVYYNLGILFAQAINYPQAAQLSWHAMQLDPTHGSSRNNWLATLNNWSLELIEQENLQQASEIIRQGLAVNPFYEPLLRGKAYLKRRHP